MDAYSHYVKFNPNTGEIVLSGYGPIPSSSEDVDVVLGQGFPETHYVKNGAILEYSKEQAARKAEHPIFFRTWSNETFQWEDARSEEAKALAVNSMKAMASTVLSNQISSSTRLYLGTTPFEQELTELKANRATLWKDSGFSGAYPTILKTDIQASGEDPEVFVTKFLDSLEVRKSALSERLQQLRDEFVELIYLANTEEEIDSLLLDLEQRIANG